jgi:hypothetical protein
MGRTVAFDTGLPGGERRLGVQVLSSGHVTYD